MTKRYESEVLASVHETALGMTEAGVMSKRTMKAFDELCLTPIEDRHLVSQGSEPIPAGQLTKVPDLRRNAPMTSDHPPQALDAFRRACQEYVVFYGFVCDGMPSFRAFIEQLMIRHSAGRSDPYRVGVGDPVSGLYPASLSLGEVLDKSGENGDFKNLIAKLTIVAIFSIWEDCYRDKIAEELNLTTQGTKARKNRIASELMGDIRQIRICIVHKNSILSDESSRFSVLDPQHFPEGSLQLTRAVMAEIMHSINEMTISVEPDG